MQVSIHIEMLYSVTKCWVNNLSSPFHWCTAGYDCFSLFIFLLGFPVSLGWDLPSWTFNCRNIAIISLIFFFSYRRMGLVVTWKCCHKGCVSVSLEVLLSSSTKMLSNLFNFLFILFLITIHWTQIVLIFYFI